MADLRFGTFLAPNMLSVYQAIADGVGEALGMSTELVVETNYENCRNDVNDICFVCSLPYVMFEKEGISPAEPIAAPVLQGERYGGRPIYFSDVIVHKDSDAESFTVLSGGSWSFNEPLAQSGYGITRPHRVSIGYLLVDGKVISRVTRPSDKRVREYYYEHPGQFFDRPNKSTQA